MMPVSTIINKKPAAATDHGGLYLVLTTTLTFERNSDHDFIHDDAARVQR